MRRSGTLLKKSDIGSGLPAIGPHLKNETYVLKQKLEQTGAVEKEKQRPGLTGRKGRGGEG